MKNVKEFLSRHGVLVLTAVVLNFTAPGTWVAGFVTGLVALDLSQNFIRHALTPKGRKP